MLYCRRFSPQRAPACCTVDAVRPSGPPNAVLSTLFSPRGPKMLYCRRFSVLGAPPKMLYSHPGLGPKPRAPGPRHRAPGRGPGTRNVQGGGLRFPPEMYKGGGFRLPHGPRNVQRKGCTIRTPPLPVHYQGGPDGPRPGPGPGGRGRAPGPGLRFGTRARARGPGPGPGPGPARPAPRTRGPGPEARGRGPRARGPGLGKL